MLSFPEEHIVILSLTAPPMNQVPPPSSELTQANLAARQETENAVKWFDHEPDLWVLIVTGSPNSKAFCAGADLKEWLDLQRQGKSVGVGNDLEGFCGISRRRGLKPIIAAVNGYAFGIVFLGMADEGGGFEMVVNW